MCSPDVLTDREAVLDRLVGVDPSALADGAAVVALHRGLARLEAATTPAAAAFGRSGAWKDDGARGAAAWLSAECSLPEGTARRRVSVGRVLPHLPVAERAWLAGDLASSAIEVLARARTDATAGRLASDEADLVTHATAHHPRTFARVVAYWRQLADATGSRTRPRPGRRRAGSTSRPASRASGSSTGCWTRSAARWWRRRWP
jgi:hypothetical protein